ncbi:MAG: class I SAM-dependent methyltransferase [Betaproteobacteria bacterium]
MANFLPLKQHMFYCLDRFIEQYGLRGPFLEIGCGRGDTSAYLAQKGWEGLAIDFSESAVAEARVKLQPFAQIAVREQAFDQLDGQWNCIILWDVLEHLDDDRAALRVIERLLAPGGQLLIAVPSNPREWRWDDDFYGHFRRYTEADITAKLTEAGLLPQVFWDFTFPVFWLMRRMYTRIKSGKPDAPLQAPPTKQALTKMSATRNAWDLPLISSLLERTAVLWFPIHRLQFRFFRNATARGHEFFVLARKAGADQRNTQSR